MLNFLRRLFGRKPTGKKKKPEYSLMDELRQRSVLAHQRGDYLIPIKENEYEDLMGILAKDPYVLSIPTWDAIYFGCKLVIIDD